MSRSHRTRRAAGAVALACAAVAVAASPATANSLPPPEPGPAPAAPQTAAPAPAAHTLTVTGTAQVKPKPRNAKNNESIKGAVAKARRAAVPLALADGRGRALNLARLTGRVLGELASITAASGAGGPFFIGPYYGEDGTFGPGRYCGTVRSAIFRTDASGKRRVVGTRARRRCRVPQYVTANLTMTFSTS
jgi:uncharacterized protein YggE